MTFKAACLCSIVAYPYLEEVAEDEDAVSWRMPQVPGKRLQGGGFRSLKVQIG